MPDCLCGCNRPVKSMGLCSSRYLKYYRMVRRGRTTWEKLIEQGKALARKPKMNNLPNSPSRLKLP